MCPKEIVLSAIKNEITSRPAWVPFVGCHAGKLIDTPADEYLKSAELMIKGIKEAVRRYKPDGIPVIFDLQLEAEALGCGVVWSKENPPSVSTHILNTKPLSSLPSIDEKSGRIPLILEVIKTLAKDIPDVALFGLITGPFTLALHLIGSEIFLQMALEPEKVKETLLFCQKTALKMADMFMEAGCDVIAVVDPMTSQISPSHFEEFVTPYVAPVFEHIKKSGRLSSFFVCGHAQKNIEVMCATKPDSICIDENIPLDYVKETCAEYGISFGGNIKLTIVLLMGSEEDCKRNALECVEIGGNKGFILAPGCDIPYSTPPKNIEAVRDIALDEYQRQIAKELVKQECDLTPILDMSDYGKTNKVVVDVITLDSEACSPCQYMVELVKSAVEEFGGLAVWREHKIKTSSGVEFMTSLMVKNIPTICIDGAIKFVSIIPSRKVLVEAIQKRILEKFRIKVKEKRAKILVFGDEGDSDAAECLDNVQKAMTELGVDFAVELVTDKKRREDYGVARLPSVVIVRAQIKSSEKVPKVDAIKEWLKDL